MTGIGTPRSKSKMPRPITASLIELHTTIGAWAGIFELRAACAKRGSTEQRRRPRATGGSAFALPMTAQR